MKINDLIRMGLRNLFRRKARTALTVIGMIIGTISIMVMFSIGYGINNIFDEAVMKDGGLSLIYVYQSYAWDESTGAQIKSAELNDELIEKIKAIEHVKNVSPVLGKQLHLKNGKYENYVYLQVIDYSTSADFGYPNLKDGTPLSKDIYRTIILCQNDLTRFFYYTGRTQKVKAVDMEKDKVIADFLDYQVPEGRKKTFSFLLNDNYGFLDAKEDSQYSWSSYMDIDYFKELYTKYANTLKAEDRKKALKSLDVYEQVYVNVDDIRQVTGVVEEINKLGVTSYSAMKDLEPMKKTAEMLKNVFLLIGAVALLVSAINIANTMIMSIYERTKEIGVMKVLGCLTRDIKKLFLFEAGLLGLIGGVIGVGFSYLVSWAVNKYGAPLLSSIVPGNNWYVDSTGAEFSQIKWWLPFVATGVAIGVGIISGFLPARRATKISAIEAMKTES